MFLYSRTNLSIFQKTSRASLPISVRHIDPAIDWEQCYHNIFADITSVDSKTTSAFSKLRANSSN